MPQYQQNKKTEKELLDNIYYYPTPEGLTLSLMPVGLIPRIKAWMIDSIFQTIIIGIILLITSVIVYILLPNIQGMMLLFSVFTLTSFLVTWLYSIYFEVYHNGMTPGKKRIGIYVCHDDGTPISLQSSMIRNLLKIIDFLPFFYVVGIFTMMFNKRLQRLGDMVAGTIVVYQTSENLDDLLKKVLGFSKKQYKQQLENIQQYDNQDLYDSCEFMSFSLTIKEQEAILLFAERSVFLSEARQHEICRTLADMIFYPNSIANQNLTYTPTQLQMIQKVLLLKAKNIQGMV